MLTAAGKQVAEDEPVPLDRLADRDVHRCREHWPRTDERGMELAAGVDILR